VSTSDFGAKTCTTNSSGYCLGVPHGLGRVPTSVLATAKAPITGTVVVGAIDADTFTATTFRIRVFTSAGTIFASRSVTFSYLASAPEPTVPPSSTPPTTTAAPPTTTAPVTTTPAPTTTEPPSGLIWPAPGSVGLQTTTTGTIPGGRLAEPGDFGAPWTGTGTQADPFLLDRKLVTGGFRFGCGCGSSALTDVWVELTSDWVQGDVGAPTPDNSRFIQVENDGPHLTIKSSNLQPAGLLSADGIRTDNHCSDKGLLSYVPFVLEDSRVSGANVLVASELELGEAGTVVRHNDLRGICSNSGDHTDVINENGHGSNTVYEANYIDGVRSGGTVVNNDIGLYNDNIGQCDACATTKNHTIRNNRLVRYNIGVLSSTNTNLTQGPWVVEGNVFDSPTPLGNSPGLAYNARTPTSQSDNTVNGSPVAF
jgi:hypothetical protein